MKARLSSLDAGGALAAAYAIGRARNPSNPEQGASDFIHALYDADPSAITVGSDILRKFGNPLLVDYGPAGIRFHNAIQAILKNPDDPAFAPYVGNLYAAGIALHEGSDKALMASSIAAYLRRAVEEYQSSMTGDGDSLTGVNAWNRLRPDTQRALLVQFFKQGPTPDRVAMSKRIAALNRYPYVPQIGVDGAGETYLANQAAIARALADAPADFADRWNAMPASASKDAAAPSFARPSDDVSQEVAGKGAAIRRLVRAPVTGEGQTTFDAGAPAVPFVPSAPIPRPGRPAMFDERFAASSEPAVAPSDSMMPLSLFSGQPMRYLPPSLFGLPDASSASNASPDDWLANLMRARARQ